VGFSVTSAGRSAAASPSSTSSVTRESRSPTPLRAHVTGRGVRAAARPLLPSGQPST